MKEIDREHHVRISIIKNTFISVVTSIRPKDMTVFSRAWCNAGDGEAEAGRVRGDQEGAGARQGAPRALVSQQYSG